MPPERVEVFVPGHVTGFFSIHRANDPRETGSRGVGITLTHGVEVAVQEDESATVTLDGNDASVDALERVRSSFDVTASITIESDVPIGAGFGASGAMALGTAIGLDALSDRQRTENELARIAHIADIEAGTGLGDVVAQLRGGIPIRIDPGGPGIGTMDGLPAHARIEYLTLGDLSTEAVLAGSSKDINAAGSVAIQRFLDEPTLQTLMRESRRFARVSDLLTADVAEVLEDVDAAGGEGAMAMLGRTVFAIGYGLSDAGYDPSACQIDHGGARRTSDVRIFYPRDGHTRL